MPFEDEVAIICNEEGKITGMAPNRAVYEENSREMLDIICGKFFIVYAPFEAERFQSLPPDLAEKYREKFKYPERFMRVNNEIVAIPAAMNGKPSSKHESKAVCALFVLREPFCKAIMTLGQLILTCFLNGTMKRTPSGHRAMYRETR